MSTTDVARSMRMHDMNLKNPPQRNRVEYASRRKHRWWKYALAGFGAALLIVIGMMTLLFFFLTANRPMVIPRAVVTTEDREALAAKWFKFQQDINRGMPVLPLTISLKEFNVFFSMLPQYKDHIHFSRAGDKFLGEASMPLDQWLPGIGKGRYLNASDVFDVYLGKDGTIQVHIESAKIDGKRVPRWLLRLMERQEFYRDIYDSAGGMEFARYLQSVEIRDGCVVLTPQNSE